jgi:drug/metabolite transporter (DMT)-like permease
MMSSASGLVAALVTVLLWASAFPMIRLGLRDFEPIPLAALRFGIAALLMLAWLGATRPKLPNTKDGLRVLLCGAIGIAVYNVMLNTGQKAVSAGAASFIVNTVPAITALLAVIFLNETFRAWAWVGTTISFAGIALIASGQPGGLSFGQGATLVLGAACCQAVFFVLQRPLIGTYGAKVCAASVVIIGALCLSPWLPSALAQAQNASSTGLAAVVYLGVFPAAVGYVTWGVAQAQFGASRAANFLYLVPPVATTLAVFLAGELPTMTTLVGGAAAIAGVIIVNIYGRT